MSGFRFTPGLAVVTAAALMLGGWASAPTPDPGLSSPPLGRLTAIPGAPTATPFPQIGWPVLDPAGPGGPVAPGTAATSAPATVSVAEPLAKKITKKKVVKKKVLKKKTVKKAKKATTKAAAKAASAPAATGTSYAARVQTLATQYGCGSTPVVVADSGHQGGYDGVRVYIRPGLGAERLAFVVAHECAHTRQDRVYQYDVFEQSAAADSVFGTTGMTAGLDALADCMAIAEGAPASQAHYTTACGGARGAAARAVLAGKRI